MSGYILITGATDGIGFRSAKEFAKKGENLIIHGRNSEKLENARSLILRLNSKVEVRIIKADFCDLEKTAEAFKILRKEKIKALINNAGCFSRSYQTTKDGFEKTYQVNHLAHFLITHILLDTLTENAPAEVVIVASMAHAPHVDFGFLRTGNFPFGYDGYAISKLCNILFAFKLARVLKNKGVNVNCLHPGVINTKLLIENWGACGMSVERSHEMIMFAYEMGYKVTGKYLKDFKVARACDFSYNEDNQDVCYNLSLAQLEQLGISF